MREKKRIKTERMENMVLDYKANTGCFQLKSDSQFYNPCMSLVDGRKQG